MENRGSKDPPLHGLGAEVRLGKLRAAFPGGERVQGAEAAGEVLGTQAALAVELAEKLVRGAGAFLGIAVDTAGNEVAVGIAPGLRLRHHVIQAPQVLVDLAQAIETAAELARVMAWRSSGVLKKSTSSRLASSVFGGGTGLPATPGSTQMCGISSGTCTPTR